MNSQNSTTFTVATGLFDIEAGLEFGDIAARLGLTTEAIGSAAKKAASKAGRWAEREGAAALAKVSNLSIRQLRAATRFRMTAIKARKGNALPGVRVWFGLNEVSAKWNDPAQSLFGVKTSVSQYPQAFIVDKLGGHVFKRTGPKRLPIMKVTHAIAGAAERAIQDVSNRAGSVYVEEFFKALDAALGAEVGTTQRTLAGL